MSKKRILLGTIPDIRREMATLYREARGKQMESSEAHRLTMILKEIVKAVEIENQFNNPNEVETSLNNIADAIRQRDIEKPTS